ncbi:uncharacterized protein LOC124423642 [Vespa crabro]|uniref:uncharacterized protein LOC124423642 n=1 Tax=Vespa crabro TaxID=7445 RepID=UPI001F003BF6|nr:uncharacterized protein LOC124423642 [Vespa crabro]XP_046817562.1 uncharacterized protein LOC124423642 [Vespa crabro]
MTNLLLHSFLLNVAGNVFIPNGSYEKTIDATLNILMSCRPVTENKYLFAGEYTDVLINHRHFFEQTTIALVAESKNSTFDPFTLAQYSFFIYKQTYQKFVKFLYRLRIFVVITSSQPILKLTLKRIKETTWANNNGYYILIDKKTAKRGCDNAKSYLWTAWQFDILYSIFICVDPVEGVLLYSYDPYTGETSNNWKEIERISGRNGHPWLLLQKRYDNESTICEFKKINRVNTFHGYEVRLCATNTPPFLYIQNNITGLDKFKGYDSLIVQTILKKLNTTMNITVKNLMLGGIDKYGSMTDLLQEIANGICDVGMNSRSFTMMWHLSYTYPHDESGLCVMSQASIEVPELRKFMMLLAQPFMLGMMIFCIITLLIMTKSDGFFEAFLNVERLVVCVAILRPPKINSYRIYICMIFILSLTANAVFQSQWYTLLMVPQFYSNIDTYDDLKDSGYDIYGTISFKDLIGEELESRFHESSYFDCFEIVKNTSNSVWISECLNIYYRLINETNLYISKSKVREFVASFIARENWPIFKTFNKHLQRLVEAGLVSMWKKQAIAFLHQQMQLKIISSTEFKVLKFKHLDFSFYILAIGNAFAIFVFLMELMVHRYRDNINGIIKRNRLLKSNRANCFKQVPSI